MQFNVHNAYPDLKLNDNNVDNHQISMPRVGLHGRMKHKFALDSSNKCEFVKYLKQGLENITNEEGIYHSY
ncbi:hypothetical protein H5410_052919 [Solanum commersonii]|uniref:Uncharacterized protein n=1 Tax=Solanum commersonii TaxID=4109 RepID=A0A9J5X4S5_SOLCO|nr:hypothetical protein H5410_052919 [Solanum commersonii]